MGCCSSKNSIEQPMGKALKGENPACLYVFPESQPNEINNPSMTIDSILLSPLAYCLISGRHDTFVYLIESMNASLPLMENLLEKQGLSGLDIIIEKGYLDLLKFCLPKYKFFFPQRFQSVEDSETSCSYPNPRKSKRSNVNVAIEKGFCEIVKYICEFFQEEFVPDEYNIHYIDEYSGENSAMVACKHCWVEIVKFLFEFHSADFSLKSKRNESVLHLAAYGSKSKSKEAFEVIKYLVETIKVDVTFQYEEILLMVNDPTIVKYVEERLLQANVFCTKEEVEKKYSLSRYKNRKISFVFEDDGEFTLDAISSIDANITASIINASFLQDSDFI